jgi:uncharacterized membrane protein YsdA (DUF1294 family)
VKKTGTVVRWDGARGFGFIRGAGVGKWRIKEDTLHVWSLAGGWPGAWFAQQVLRHKSRKESFRQAPRLLRSLYGRGLMTA